jgi:hypothetical protein
MEAGSKSPNKKPYVVPNLVSYGDIREITQAIASNTKTADGGTGKTNKTG